MDGKKKYLLFLLMENHYCLSLASVREVIVASEITALPNSDISEIGVINLRGEIITVLDLAAKLGRGKTTVSIGQSCVVICQQEQLSIGLLVEAVVAVKTLGPEEIMPRQAPSVEEAPHPLVAAFYQDRELDELVMILDIHQVVASALLKKQ